MVHREVVFEYTLTAKQTLGDIASFLRRQDTEPRPVISELLEQFEKQVGQFPQGSQICPELLKIGCAKYREFNRPGGGGYRILYSVDGFTITVHAFLSQKQDIQQLLFRQLVQP